MNDYTDIPNWLFERRDLTPMQKWLYICLLSEARKNVEADFCVISSKRFSTFGCSVSSLRHLQERGLITCACIENTNGSVFYNIDLLSQKDGSEATA